MIANDHMRHVLFQVDGEYLGVAATDVTDWIAVDLDAQWDRFWHADPFLDAHERGWEFRAVNTWKQGIVGHQGVTRFLFPPEDADNAMLFKLTWGGQQ